MPTQNDYTNLDQADCVAQVETLDLQSRSLRASLQNKGITVAAPKLSVNASDCLEDLDTMTAHLADLQAKLASAPVKTVATALAALKSTLAASKASTATAPTAPAKALTVDEQVLQAFLPKLAAQAKVIARAEGMSVDDYCRALTAPARQAREQASALAIDLLAQVKAKQISLERACELALAAKAK